MVLLGIPFQNRKFQNSKVVSYYISVSHQILHSRSSPSLCSLFPPVHFVPSCFATLFSLRQLLEFQNWKLEGIIGISRAGSFNQMLHATFSNDFDTESKDKKYPRITVPNIAFGRTVELWFCDCFVIDFVYDHDAIQSAQKQFKERLSLWRSICGFVMVMALFVDD